MLGDLELPNRVVMAPLTRMRMPNANGVPNDLMRDYYMQRASAGLIITEGTFVSDQARGWFRAPGVYTEEQREAGKQSPTVFTTPLWVQAAAKKRAASSANSSKNWKCEPCPASG
jgi:2,4-dienoyl-CoA reductase-like NADH-dependent reductase (Old Yellow Enzyme family)